MKKVLAIAAILSMLCCFTACNTGSSNSSSSESEESIVSENTSSEEKSAEESGRLDELMAVDVVPSSTESESSEKSDDENSAPEDESEAGDSSEVSESSESESEDGAYEYGGISLVLPENFTIDESTDSLAIAYPPTYPDETDNINFTKTNESISVYSKENIDKTMKTIFDDYEGCKNYKTYKIDGCDAVTYDHTINVGGAEVKQRQVAVFADNTVIVTFTDMTGNYTDVFQEVIDSIKVVK